MKFINDINSVIFTLIFIFVILPLCSLLSFGVYFLRITEAGWRDAFTADFTRLVVVSTYGVIGMVIVGVVACIIAVAWAWSTKPILAPEYDPKITYTISGGNQPALEDHGDRRWIPAQQQARLPQPRD